MAHLIIITNPLTGDKVNFTASVDTIPDIITKFLMVQPELAHYLLYNRHSIRLNKELIELDKIETTLLKNNDTVLIYPNINVPVAIMAVIQAAASAAGAAAGIIAPVGVGAGAAATGAAAGAAVATVGGTVGISAGMSSAIMAASYVGAAIGTLAPMAALTMASKLFSANKPNMGSDSGGLGDASPTYGWSVKQMANEGLPVAVGYGRYKTGGNIVSITTQSKLQLSYTWTGAKDIDMQGTGIPNLIALPLCPSDIQFVGQIPYVNMGIIGLWPPIRGFACDLDQSVMAYSAIYFRLWCFADLKRLVAWIVNQIIESVTTPNNFTGMKNHGNVIQRFMQAFSRHAMYQINTQAQWGHSGGLIGRIRDLVKNAAADSAAIHDGIFNLVDATGDTAVDSSAAIVNATNTMVLDGDSDPGDTQYNAQYGEDYDDTNLAALANAVKDWWDALVQETGYRARFTLTPLIATGLNGGRFAHIFDSYSTTADNMGCYFLLLVAWTPEMVTELLSGTIPTAKWYISNMNFLVWVAGDWKIGDSTWHFPQVPLSEEQILHQLTALGEGEMAGIDKVTINKTPINTVPGTDFVFFDGRNTQRFSAEDAQYVDTMRWYQKAGIEKSVNDELKEIGDCSNFNSVAECNNVEIKIDFTAYHMTKKGKVEDLGDYPMQFAIMTGLSDNITMEDTYMSDVSSITLDLIKNTKCMVRVYDFYGGSTVLCHKSYYAFELLGWITKVIEWILFYFGNGFEAENAAEMANSLSISFDAARYEAESEYRFNMRKVLADAGNYFTIETALKDYNIGDRFSKISGMYQFCNMVGIDFDEEMYAAEAETEYRDSVTNLIRDAMNNLFINTGKKLAVKVVRLTSIDDDRHPTYTDNMIVKGYTEVSYVEYDYPNTAMGALAIRATNEFNSSPPEVMYNVKGRKVRAPKLTLTVGGTRVYREFAWWDEDAYVSAGVYGAYRSMKDGGALCTEDLTDWVYEFSDNPIWCLYDFLINRRFGVGNYINQADTDIAQFLEMAHYCDQMVPDGVNRTASTITETEINGQDSDLFKKERSRYSSDASYRQIGSTDDWDTEYGSDAYNYIKKLIGEAVFARKTDGGWTKAVISDCDRVTFPLGVLRNAKFTIGASYPNGVYWSNDVPILGSSKSYQLGQKRFRLDINIDQRSSAPDIIKTICDTFRCAPVWMNGTVFPIIDKWEYPVAVVGMGNIIQDSFSLVYTPLSKTPNVLECQFSNEELDFDKDTRVKIAANVDLAYSSDITKTIRRESSKLIGITRPSQLERELTYRLNTYQERIKVITFSMGIEHLTFHAGQVIAFTHDILTLGSYSGRIISFDGDSTIYIDQPLVKSGGETWKIQITQVVQDEINAEEYYEVVGEFSVSSVTENAIVVTGLDGFVPSNFDNYAIGRVDYITENYKILSVQPNGAGEAEIGAVNWGVDTTDVNGIKTNSVFGTLRQVAPLDTSRTAQYVTYDDCLVDTRSDVITNVLTGWIGPNPVVLSPLEELAGEVGIKVTFALPTGAIANGYSHAIVSLSLDGSNYVQVCEVKYPGTMARVTKAMGATLGIDNYIQVCAVYTSGAVSAPDEEHIRVTGVSSSAGFEPPVPTNLRLSEWCKRYPLQFGNDQARELGNNFIEVVWDRVNARNIFGKNSWLIDPQERFVKEYEIALYRTSLEGAYTDNIPSGTYLPGQEDEGWTILPSGHGLHYVSSVQNRFKIQLDEVADVTAVSGEQYQTINYPFYKVEVRALTDDMFASDPATLFCSYPGPDKVILPWDFRLYNMYFLRWHYPKWWKSVDHYNVHLDFKSPNDAYSGALDISTDGNIPMLFTKLDPDEITLNSGALTWTEYREQGLWLTNGRMQIKPTITTVDKFGREYDYTDFGYTDAEGDDDVEIPGVPTNLQVLTTGVNPIRFTRLGWAKLQWDAPTVDANGAALASGQLLWYNLQHCDADDYASDPNAVWHGHPVSGKLNEGTESQPIGTIRGLPAGSEQVFRVHAHTIAGAGEWGNIASGTIVDTAAPDNDTNVIIATDTDYIGTEGGKYGRHAFQTIGFEQEHIDDQNIAKIHIALKRKNRLISQHIIQDVEALETIAGSSLYASSGELCLASWSCKEGEGATQIVDDISGILQLTAVNDASVVSGEVGGWGNCLDFHTSPDSTINAFSSGDDVPALDFAYPPFSISFRYKDIFTSGLRYGTFVAKESGGHGYNIFMANSILFATMDGSISTLRFRCAFPRTLTWKRVVVNVVELRQDSTENEIWVEDDVGGVSKQEITYDMYDVENYGSLSNAGPILLGHISGNAQVGFGRVDDIQIFNYVLRPQDVQQLVDAPFPGNPDITKLYYLMKLDNLLQEKDYTIKMKYIGYNGKKSDWTSEYEFTTLFDLVLDMTKVTAFSAEVFAMTKRWFKQNQHNIHLQWTLPETCEGIAYNYEIKIAREITVPGVGAERWFTHVVFFNNASIPDLDETYGTPITEETTIPLVFRPSNEAIGDDSGFRVNVRALFQGKAGTPLQGEDSWDDTDPGATWNHFPAGAASGAIYNVEPPNESFPAITPTATQLLGIGRFFQVDIVNDSYDYPDNFSHWTVHALKSDIPLFNASDPTQYAADRRRSCIGYSWRENANTDDHPVNVHVPFLVYDGTHVVGRICAPDAIYFKVVGYSWQAVSGVGGTIYRPRAGICSDAFQHTGDIEPEALYMGNFRLVASGTSISFEKTTDDGANWIPWWGIPPP